MKKKLLIMMNSMGMGGVEKALLNLLSVLNRDIFDVTILFVRKEGEYLNQIPEWVKVEEIKISNFEKEIIDMGQKVIIKENLREFKFISTFKNLLEILKRNIILKMGGDYSKYYESIFRFLPLHEGDYDIALDFNGHSSITTYYISEKVNARIKATWLHSSNFGDNVINFKFYYSKYNRIFGVSKDCIDKFSKIFPEYADRCETFYNILLSEDIKRKADERRGFAYEFGGAKILTVGRLSFAKGYDIAIAVTAKLKKDGSNFKWFVIGEGSERLKLEKLIKHYNVEDCFILLGPSDNPYPYMKQSDIYVQPSRFEGYCITLAEARILNKAIITTNFFGAQEQIVDGETGLIINFDEDKIYDAIKKLLSNNGLRLKFEENLSKEKSNDSKDVEKLYKLLDESNEIKKSS